MKNFNKEHALGSAINAGYSNTAFVPNLIYDNGEEKLNPYTIYNIWRLEEGKYYVISYVEEIYTIFVKLKIDGALLIHVLDIEYKLKDRLWVRGDDSIGYFGEIPKTEIRKNKLDSIPD